MIALWAGLAGLMALVAVARFVPTSTGPSQTQLTWDQLQPGDCLTGSNMALGTGDPWPDEVTSVPCTRSHLAEVIFADDIWPQSAAYPGDEEIGIEAIERCNAALADYTGETQDYIQDFALQPIMPGSTDWADGDRSLQCVAYKSSAGQLGGTPVSYSIKARRP